MKALEWIWWLGGPLFALICAGYAVAFAGYGLSFWATKPEPDAFFLAVAFAGAALMAIRDAIEAYPAAIPPAQCGGSDA